MTSEHQEDQYLSKCPLLINYSGFETKRNPITIFNHNLFQEGKSKEDLLYYIQLNKISFPDNIQKKLESTSNLNEISMKAHISCQLIKHAFRYLEDDCKTQTVNINQNQTK